MERFKLADLGNAGFVMEFNIPEKIKNHLELEGYPINQVGYYIFRDTQENVYYLFQEHFNPQTFNVYYTVVENLGGV